MAGERGRVAARPLLLSRGGNLVRRRPGRPRPAGHVSPVRSVAGPGPAPSISIVVPGPRRGTPARSVARRPPRRAWRDRGRRIIIDGSHDRTAELARSHGATVVAAGDPPAGWTGKCWALQRGLERSSGDWVVTFDADVRPLADLPRSLVARASGDRFDLVTLATRAAVRRPGRALATHHAADHVGAALRTGRRGGRPPRQRAVHGLRPPAPDRRRRARACRGAVVEDVALARHLAGAG